MIAVLYIRYTEVTQYYKSIGYRHFVKWFRRILQYISHDIQNLPFEVRPQKRV